MVALGRRSSVSARATRPIVTSGADEASEVTSRVAESLRALRRARGYSLEDLASLTGVSRATLSQIESNKTNPTIGVLWKISAGLGVPFSALLGESVERKITVVRRETQGIIRSEDGSFESRSLTQSRSLGPVEIYELYLAPRSRHPSSAHPAGTTEGLVVISGVIRVSVGSALQDAGPGDSLLFAADEDHVYENPGRVAARAINVIAYQSGK